MKHQPGHRRVIMWMAAVAATLSACGALPAVAPPITAAPPPPGTLRVSPQNDTFGIGRNRLSVVIQDRQGKPVLDAVATVEADDAAGAATAPAPIKYVGSDYPRLPIYTGLIDLPHANSWRLVVHARAPDAPEDAGQAFITAEARTSQLQVGDRMPPIVQPVVGAGTTLSSVDSGIPPDAWHDTTVAAALAAHRPMLVFLGEPGRCVTTTCGDTVTVLRRVCATMCATVVFEHIEVHNPADGEALNPAWLPFHFRQEQPWMYVTTPGGIIADRFEGPAPYDQILAAARGAREGKVPAV